MQSMLRVMFAALVAVAIGHLPTGAMAQPEVKQIKLTEKQIQGFIGAQKEMQPIMEKIQGATSDQLDPKLQAALEAAAKKNGFKDMAEYDDVAANVSMVMAGIDPQTKVFTEPQEGADAGLLPFDHGEPLVEQLEGAQLAPLQALVELRDALYGSASWIAFTTKNPSLVSGALASTRSRGSDGSGRSSRIRFSSGTTWAVGSMLPVSTSRKRSMWARMALSCSA